MNKPLLGLGASLLLSFLLLGPAFGSTDRPTSVTPADEPALAPKPLMRTLAKPTSVKANLQEWALVAYRCNAKLEPISQPFVLKIGTYAQMSRKLRSLQANKVQCVELLPVDED
jgi:hypothetical protein